MAKERYEGACHCGRVRCLAGVEVERLEPASFDGRNWEQAITGRLPWR
jgi:hypothetical protein